MTRKDYERAAEIIRIEGEGSQELIGTFVQFFQGDNPRFDKERFKAACESAKPQAKKSRVAKK